MRVQQDGNEEVDVKKRYQSWRGVRTSLICIVGLLLLGTAAQAQSSGRDAAQEYMGQKPILIEEDGVRRDVAQSSGRFNPERYLTIHLGVSVSDQAYRWGKHTDSDVSKWQLGFTYRLGQWLRAADFLIRVDWMNYELMDERVQKLSFLPMIQLPDAASYFPLYFGFGLGPGVFLKQLPDESSISIDYQLVVGARFFEVAGSTGFFIETGLKNHILLLSDGQHSDHTFVAVGAVFTF